MIAIFDPKNLLKNFSCNFFPIFECGTRYGSALGPGSGLEKMLAQPWEKDIFCVHRSLEELKKFKNKPRHLFLCISILTCQQKSNPFDETVPLSKKIQGFHYDFRS